MASETSTEITIDVKDVSKGFGPHKAVQNLSFAVKKGEILLDIQTDKVEYEVESPDNGILLKKMFADFQ